MQPGLLPHERLLTGALLFGSGFAGLVYQVLWMRELGFLFGNDSFAVAATLAAFFLGIAAGSAAFGNRAARSRRPLLAYAGLELAVAVAALLYFGLLDVFAALYEPLFAAFGDRPIAFTTAKFGLALVVLFPPAFFMGGTLPVMSQHLVRHASALGSTAAFLYAVNTAGAAAGAFSAAFLLVPRLGVNGSYAAALAITVGVAGAAALLARSGRPALRARLAPAPRGDESGAAPPGLRLLAWVSGFTTLALEVLWTRMFAQVLQNSVYTFAAILVTFLLALALGAGFARWLAARGVAPRHALPTLLVGGGLLVMATPLIFTSYTAGLASLGSRSGFTGYVLRVFGAALLVLGAPVVWLGVLFPYLMRAAEAWHAGAGRTVGRLAALNTLGGVLGSLAAGFVLLEGPGLWRSIAGLGAAYLGVGVLYAAHVFRPRVMLPAAVAALVAVAASAEMAARLPRIAAGSATERVIEIVEGSAATVAVVQGARGRRLKHNNHYGLGGTDDRGQEARQAHWPLILHPSPRRVFFLGMGTGITAGAALQHPIESLLVTELDRSVVRAAERHFSGWTNGLFDAPRARVVVEDGRNVLRGSRQRHDVIVADLFLPWKAGVGNLYTREHYAIARERLAPGGLYAQWLLLVQFSEQEFASVTRSMLEVFPRVTLWRANERTTHPLVLLLGETDPRPLELADLERRIRETAPTRFDAARFEGERSAIPASAAQLLYGYQGNLTAARALFEDAPINTDDRPFIEYNAPVTHRGKRSGRASALRDDRLLALYDAVFAAAPPRSDALLARLPPALRGVPAAGLDAFRGRVLERSGRAEAAAEAFAREQRALDAAFGPGAERP